MFSISVLIFTSFVLSLVHSSDEGGGNVLCSVQEYVKVGLEFEQCQKTALFNYSKGLDPCPMLKKVVDTCAYNVKVRQRRMPTR